MASLFLSRLTADQRKDLVGRLHEAQGGDCFICEKPIDLDVHGGSVDIDHVEPISLGGKDDETNFALTHDSCNRSKQASDLRIARVLARFQIIREEYWPPTRAARILPTSSTASEAQSTRSDSTSREIGSRTASARSATTRCGPCRSTPTA